MLTPETLLSRIRGEYREMPGLGLTFAQACRLWQVDQATCQRMLEQLVRESFLYKTDKGTYVALSTVSGKYAASQLRSGRAPMMRSA
jgi:DNA-binding IclR family transcriptional regulator